MNTHRLASLGLALLLIGLTVSTLNAGTFTVTRTNNTGPGSLPVVLTQANATPGRQTINFAVTGTITLAGPLPTITNNLTINGRTDGPVVINGGGAISIFSFAAGSTSALSRLTLANGYSGSGGAAIVNAGNLSVSDSILANHASPSASGGAISNIGTMTIATSMISDNRATNGGAIWNAGLLTIIGGTLSRNQADVGGAISSIGRLVLANLTVCSNVAIRGMGGAIFNAGDLECSATSFITNSVSGSVASNGVPGLFSDMTGTSHWQSCGGGGGGGGGSPGMGGGLFSLAGTLRFTNCTFGANSAKGGTGGNGGAGGYTDGPRTSFPSLGSTGGAGAGDAGGLGGAGGGVPGRLRGGTGLDGGYASGGGGGGGGRGYSPSDDTYGLGGFVGLGGFGAGDGGRGGAGWGGTVYSYRTAQSGYGGNGGDGVGAGIFIKNGTAMFVNCTITLNTSVGGTGGTPRDTNYNGTYGGMNGEGWGAGLYNYEGVVTLLNTIAANNLSDASSPDLFGTFSSTGFNLIGNNQGSTGLSIFDFQNEPANLGPLQDNGGPTLTCVPLSTSLAIGYGTGAGAPAVDQRGFPRGRDGAWDMGSVEVITNALMIAGSSSYGPSGFTLTTVLDSTNSYRIRGSTNLVNWTDLTNYTGGGAQRFTDSAATNFHRRFYRAVLP